MAKTKQTKRMIAMALAAAVTVTAVPVDAYAASSYSAKVARAQKKAETSLLFLTTEISAATEFNHSK